MIPVTTFAGRKVAAFGMARSGLAAAHALIAGGAEMACWDDGEAARGKAMAEGLPIVDLRSADWRGFAALVLAPGVPLTNPEPHWTVVKARAAGVEVIGDTELFFRELARQTPRPRVAAITGTNGKSTTTALTAHLLRHAGMRTAMGGNIGDAVLGLAPFAATEVYVLELSSYQIDLTPTLRPDTAALLNLTPDHLDRHGTMAHYAAVKARLIDGLPAGGTGVIGVDDAHCRSIADAYRGPAKLLRLSVERAIADGIYAADGLVHDATSGPARVIADLNGIEALRGRHNWQNAAAAFAMCRSLGIGEAALQAGLRAFPGLAHRMEIVGRIGEVLFVNDSKATNADATAKALAAYDRVYWIAGGLAKEGGIADLAGYFPRIVRAYLIGKAASDFKSTLDGRVPSEDCGTLEAAVAAAGRDAVAAGGRAVVLLSPACASFDQFKDFEHRGNTFRDLVGALPGVVMTARGVA